MAARTLINQETFIARAIRRFRQNVAGAFARINHRRRNANARVEARLDQIYRWELAHKRRVIISLAIFIFAALTVWFLIDWTRGRVEGDAVQTGVGGLVGGAFIGLIGSSVAAIAGLAITLLANRLFKLITPIVLFVPLILWAPLYALAQGAGVAARLLLLIPLFVLFLGSRLIQLWNGIFYTCPSRSCAYRGLPIYECRYCSQGNRKLWPNLHGLLWHHCIGCDKRLPALDLLGRKTLGRRCGGCKIPLLGKHAGRAPERLIAIAGGPGSGKTNYLLMAVNEITGQNSPAPIKGLIDDDRQEEEFNSEWRNLSSGVPAAKTSQVVRAFLLYANVGGSKCQLYLYDAPGEEFTTVSSMTSQHYLPLIEGFIILVDPLSFDPVAKRAATAASGLPFQEVVTSTLATASSAAGFGRSGKIAKRVAVVISKADLDCVKEHLGDITTAAPSAGACRHALTSWGAENALHALEHRFDEVEYFACSPLGRNPGPGSRTAFKGAGVLEPLVWILTGKRNDSGEAVRSKAA